MPIFPEDFRRMAEKAYPSTDFVLPPLPNQLFTRDSSCWIYGGVTVKRIHLGLWSLSISMHFKANSSILEGSVMVWTFAIGGLHLAIFTGPPFTS